MEDVEALAVGVCTGLNLYSLRVCENVVHFMAPIGWYIQEQNPDLTSYDICAVVYQSENCGTPRAERLQFEIEVSGEGPEIEVGRLHLPFNFLRCSFQLFLGSQRSKSQQWRLLQNHSSH